MSDALIQIVDENDVPLRGGTKQEIWNAGLCHRVARVMCEDKRGNVLLQKRTADTPLFPECWDNSAAGHVDEGESHLVAAKRELAEEIGIKDIELEEVKYYKTDGKFEQRILRRWTRLYKVILPESTDFLLQPDEVIAVRWVSRQELADIVTNHPDTVSDGLREAYEIMYKP